MEMSLRLCVHVPPPLLIAPVASGVSQAADSGPQANHSYLHHHSNIPLYSV